MTTHPSRRRHKEEPAILDIGGRTVTIDSQGRPDDGLSARTPTYTVSTAVGTVYRVDHGTEHLHAADSLQAWFARHGDRPPIGPYPSINVAVRALLEETLR